MEDNKQEEEIRQIVAQAFFQARWTRKYIPLAYIVDYRNGQGTDTDDHSGN